jgi:hypothetical protein
VSKPQTRTDTNPPARIPDPPTPLGILPVHRKKLLEKAGYLHGFTSNDHRGPGYKIHIQMISVAVPVATEKQLSPAPAREQEM